MMFDQHRLRNYRTNAAGPRESSRSNDERNEKDDKITHLRIVLNIRRLKAAGWIATESRGLRLKPPEGCPGWKPA